jgi:chromosome segregation ATPase
MADWMFMGGLGTAIAVWSAGEYLVYAQRAREIGKELKDVKTRIHDMQQAQFELKIRQLQNAPQNAPMNDNSLKDEFSPAAKAEIEALRKKLAKLEGQVGQMQEDKDKGLDKPKFKNPFGKKPDGQ